ncbi:MAG TPA: hypothetical protein VH796_18945 [Nitrososphaeraceae archaeon]
MANKHGETIFLIIVLSVLFVISTRSTILENVFAKNYNANMIPTEDNLCRYQIPQANTVCHAYNPNIRTHIDRMSEQDFNFDNSITLGGSFLKHYDEDRADELGYGDGDDLYQSDNASGVGYVNSSGNVMPAFVGHSHGGQNGGHYDGGNHPGTRDGGVGNGSHHGSTNDRDGNGNGHDNGSSHNGNNDQNNKHSGDSNKNNSNKNDNNIQRCIPVTLSDLPGQTQPLEPCLVIGMDTNVATEIGNATFTLNQSSGDEFKLTINGLNSQIQPAIITTKSGVKTPIIVPGLGTGNVLIGVFIS